ncbi:S9 family peptidase [Arundinibacter roseus]|uniref:Proline-specific endopeptidase n=1 Tax=Arundinibacter roseus TaxID=2070510 RepID=A0A4V2X8A5_9BACT|nr:S9 family peptidase [Arundinibacter roseus]TDB59135.1 S9 family peptidase [Arundinibacter roseus]
MPLFKTDQIAPRAGQRPTALTIHSETRNDVYYWLRERESEVVLNYLHQENAYTDSVMAPLQAFKEKLFQEMKSRIREKDESVPVRDGSYLYYSRYEEGAEYPFYCRKKELMEAPEELMLNLNERAQGHSYYQATFPEISDDESVAAIGEDTVSRRLYTLRFKNLRTGEWFADEIPNTEGGNYAWAADNQTVFYIRKDEETLLGYQVWQHVLGTDPGQDVLLYEEADDQYYLGLYRMKSKKYVALVADHNGVATEYRLLPADQPTAGFTTVIPRRRGHEYAVEHFQDTFYLVTNQGYAENFKLVRVAENDVLNETKWEEIIPHRADVYLEGIEIFRRFLVVQERREGLLRIRIMEPESGLEHYLNFGEAAYTAYLSANPEFDTDVLRYGYTSLTTPNSTYDYDMAHRTKILRKEQEVVGDFDKTHYTTERLYATARDGARVPISLVYRNDFTKNGSGALLQYAYGSYGSSMDPVFSAARLSLLDRGFAFAICHIRGGQEMGRAWYDQGRLLHKMNTFTDFIDCSEFLIQEGWTSPAHLYAMGGSAGGLLMGAVANLRPHLYHGMVAQVPFVDVVTTMLDDTIPLTTGEYEEWGNPNVKLYYDYMMSYSPYDNVTAQAYPHVLVTTGLHDSQVQYWEPAKWVAKLRELKTDEHLILLHCDMETGHGGASGRFKRLHDIALEYTFLLGLEDKAEV